MRLTGEKALREEIVGKIEKSVYNQRGFVYNNTGNLYGGAPDSIAGERRNKHAADGVPALKTFR